MFGRRKKQELPPLISDEELADECVNFNSVVAWLNGLSDAEFKKVINVVQIYRAGDVKVAKELEVENTPTTFINPPEPEAQLEPDFISDLLDDDQAEKPKKTTRSKKQ